MKKILFVVLCLLSAASVRAGDDDAKVRNVIYMIGDGMGLTHVSLLKIENDYKPTAFDRAHGVALITTHSANNRVTDSAAAGTALAAGHKTDNAMLGQTPDGEPVRSLMARASDKGLATGIAVVCYLQHATPGAFYAHVAGRGDNKAITRDLDRSKIDVLIGGGRKWLAEEHDSGGSYLDAFARRGYRVVESLDQAGEVHDGKLLCAAAEEGLPEASERGDFLPRATEKALEILSNNTAGGDKGFVLMVEGSYIDVAAHANDAGRLLAEMRDFDRAVAVAMDFADRTPGTLVVVAADHETGGLSMPANDADFTRGENGVKYEFSTRGHSGSLVPVYLYGAGADRIRGVMDNTDLARRIMELQGLE